MNKTYFIIRDNTQQGPFSLEELREQGITSATMVWTEGMPQWAPAWQVEELKNIIYGNQTAATPPPYTGPQPGQGQQDTPPHPFYNEQPHHAPQPMRQPKKHGHSFAGWLLLLVVVAIVGAMVVTNPSRDKHAMNIKENVRKGVVHAMQGDDAGLLAQGLSLMGQTLIEPIIDAIVDSQIEYHNYFLFSTTTISTDEKNYTVSYGVLGKVFTASEEQIAGAISNELNKKEKEAGSMIENVISTLPGGDNETTNESEEQPSDEEAEEEEGLGEAIGKAIINHMENKLKKELKGVRSAIEPYLDDDKDSEAE